MGCEVRWTASARSDVARIIRHIAVVLDSPQAAAAHLDAFEEAVARIAEFPESCSIGRQSSLAVRELRLCFAKRYVLLYFYDGKSVLVYRVFHLMQDYARLIEND